MYMLKTDGWYLERLTLLVGGIITLISVLLVVFVSPYWLILTGLVGFNLIVFALSGFCLMSNILYKLGARPRLSRE